MFTVTIETAAYSQSKSTHQFRVLASRQISCPFVPYPNMWMKFTSSDKDEKNLFLKLNTVEWDVELNEFVCNTDEETYWCESEVDAEDILRQYKNCGFDPRIVESAPA